MSLETEFCQILGHDYFKASRICRYQQCPEEYKLLCEMCLERKLHNHQLQNLNHIMLIDDYIKQIANSQQVWIKLQQQFKQKGENWMIQNKIIKLSLHQKYLKFKDINKIQISQSNHLAFGGNHSKVELISLENNLENHNIKIKNYLQQLKFSSDNNYLFLTDQQCRLYQYNLINKKLIYVRKIISQEYIKHILPINNSYSICSSNTQIFIVNLKQRKQISKFRMNKLQKYPKLNVNALAYDYDNDVIIIGSWTANTITILRQSSIILQQKIQINLQLEQFSLQSNQILYICGKQQILKYQIDYENKNIVYFCRFRDVSYERISFFNFIRSINIIIIVNESKVLILDTNLQSIQTIIHDSQIDLLDNYLQISDLQFLNYLVIPSQNQLMIYKLDLIQKKKNVISCLQEQE